MEFPVCRTGQWIRGFEKNGLETGISVRAFSLWRISPYLKRAVIHRSPFRHVTLYIACSEKFGAGLVDGTE